MSQNFKSSYKKKINQKYSVKYNEMNKPRWYWKLPKLLLA